MVLAKWVQQHGKIPKWTANVNKKIHSHALARQPSGRLSRYAKDGPQPRSQSKKGLTSHGVLRMIKVHIGID
jgi:hypothetical protein